MGDGCIGVGDEDTGEGVPVGVLISRVIVDFCCGIDGVKSTFIVGSGFRAQPTIRREIVINSRILVILLITYLIC